MGQRAGAVILDGLLLGICLGVVATVLVGAAMGVLTDRGQRLGDLAAGTVVVETD